MRKVENAAGGRSASVTEINRLGTAYKSTQRKAGFPTLGPGYW